MKYLTEADIGKGKATEAEKEFNRRYMQLLRDIGLLQASYDGHDKPLIHIKYLKWFKTEQEFVEARTKILELFSEHKEIPKDLYTKVCNTLKENLGNIETLN